MTGSSTNQIEAQRPELLEYPEFELDFLVDDPLDPYEITIYSAGKDASLTHWISGSFDLAVPLESVR